MLGVSWRRRIRGITSLYLGSEDIEPVLCREHCQEFKSFCKTHMTELCITCSRIEHKHCETVIHIEQATRDIYSKVHSEEIKQGVTDPLDVSKT